MLFLQICTNESRQGRFCNYAVDTGSDTFLKALAVAYARVEEACCPRIEIVEESCTQLM
jgi:hypothetical protein